MKKLKKVITLLVISMALSMLPVIAVQAQAATTNSTVSAKAYTGWKIVNGDRYYYRNGVKVTGWQTIGGYKYCFFSNGKARRNGLYKIGSKYYYFNKYAVMSTGWRTLSGSRVYHFRTDGAADVGLRYISGKYYYFNYKGERQYGWQTINGYQYYFRSNGQAVTTSMTSNGYRYYFQSNGRFRYKEKVVVKRALLIGEADYPGTSNDLPACEKDSQAMKKLVTATGYSVVNRYSNSPKSRIKTLIKTAFAGATSNDVSLFYYSGHGASDGSLYTADAAFLTPKELASWLGAVPGKVIVILDCCHSGAVIGKSSQSVSKSFNENVVSAFDDVNVMTKDGELCTSKFYVLTACRKAQYSYCNSSYSYFTYYLVDGAGYNYFSGARNSSAQIDKNNDKKLTLEECWNHVYYKIYEQDAARYPTNSNFVLFKR